MAVRSRINPRISADQHRSPSDWHSDQETLRLITPQEAIERIGTLLAKEGVDTRQQLLMIAGIAIAAVIAQDGVGTEVENVAGLQECVNCSLFIYNPQ
jgi:hypothetical protein